MKTLVFGVISLAVVFALALKQTPFAGSRNLKIALITWRGESDGEKGFKDGLKALGYSVDYTIMDAGQDRKNLGDILRNKLEPKINDFDYIYTFGTTVSKAAKDIINNRIPQLFNIVAAPVEADIVQSMEETGGNISGATNNVPLSVQIETAFKVIQFKHLGLIFNPREKNSMIERERLYDIAKKFQFEVFDLRSPPAQDMLEQNLQKLIDKSILVDVVYLPLDSYILSNAKLIGSKLRDAKVKSIGSLRDFIENGALLGVVPDYYQLGKAVASIVDRHEKGERLQDIAVQTPQNPLLMINKTTADLLETTIPEAVLKKAIIVE